MALPSEPGEGSFHLKMDNGARWKFCKELLRDTKVLFYGRGLNFFHPLEVSILKEHIISCYIFRFKTLKGTAIAPSVDLLRLNTVRGTQTTFSSPRDTDQHPQPFYMGVPSPLPTPPPPGLRSLSIARSLNLEIIACRVLAI